MLNIPVLIVLQLSALNFLLFGIVPKLLDPVSLRATIGSVAIFPVPVSLRATGGSVAIS